MDVAVFVPGGRKPVGRSCRNRRESLARDRLSSHARFEHTSSREVRIRVPFLFSVVYFSWGILPPKKGANTGEPRYASQLPTLQLPV